MHIELRCPACSCGLSAPPDTKFTAIIDWMIEQGPWFALGEGATFEDMIFAALLARGRICCPNCGEPVVVSEHSLGQLTRELFPCW